LVQAVEQKPLADETSGHRQATQRRVFDMLVILGREESLARLSDCAKTAGTVA
jgi:hypothetical protein